MDQWGLVGISVLLLIIAVGVATGVNNLDVIARELRKIRDEIQELRSGLDSERHPRDERDPF